MWTPCHVLFASSHIWAFAPWCASSVSLTRPRNACCRYFDIWRQRCRPLFKYQQRYWPCFRYQRRYRNKCKHKIHGDLRFGEEEDATSRTYLKKNVCQNQFLSHAWSETLPPLLICRNQAKLISMFAPSFPILLSAAAPPNTQGAINYNSNSKLFTITLDFIIVPSCYQHSTHVLSLSGLFIH